jgi:hypothetical protein
LQELSEHAPRLIPRVLPCRRFPTEVESAAYFAASETLRLTDREVTVDALADGERLRVVISTTASLGPSIVRIRDRVGAVGGTVESIGGELRLEMPCAL